MKSIRDIDLQQIGPSKVHMPLFAKIRDNGHVIEDDFLILQNFVGCSVFIVDVGANIGAFSLTALNMIGKVDALAFEPNVSLRWFQEEVRKSFEKNSCKYDIRYSGLADRAGSIDLYIPKIDDWHVIGEASMDLGTFENPVVRSRLAGYSSGGLFELERARVDIQVFDDIFAYDLSGYDYVILKIDVENYEPFVLSGMKEFIQKYKPLALIENSKSKTLSIMSAYGYGAYTYNSIENEFLFAEHPTGSNAIFIHRDNMPAVVKISNSDVIVNNGKNSQKKCAITKPCDSEPLLQNNIKQLFKFKEGFAQAMKCTNCGYIWFQPPSQSVLDDYYNSVYPQGSLNWYNYESDHAQYKVFNRANIVEEIFKNFGFDDKDVYHEFGCAFGGTVAELRRRGYEVSGSELNKIAVEEARKNGHEYIYSQDANSVIAARHGSANVVFSFHALEHFSRPIEFLINLKNRLDDRAIVVLAVPNGQALDPMVYGYTSYSWFSYPGHLHMWTASSSLCLAEAAGYKVLFVKTNPVPVRSGVQVPLTSEPVSGVENMLRNEILQERYLGEELIMVLTPENSKTASEFTTNISDIQGRLVAHRSWEDKIGKIVAQSPALQAKCIT